MWRFSENDSSTEKVAVPWEGRASVGILLATLDTLKAFFMPWKYLKGLQRLSVSEALKYWLVGVIAVLIVFLTGELRFFYWFLKEEGFHLLAMLPLFLLLVGIRFAMIWFFIVILSWVTKFVLTLFGSNPDYDQVLASYYYIQGNVGFIGLLIYTIIMGAVFALTLLAPNSSIPLGAYFVIMPWVINGGLFFVLGLLFFVYVMKELYGINAFASGVSYLLSGMITGLAFYFGSFVTSFVIVVLITLMTSLHL